MSSPPIDYWLEVDFAQVGAEIRVTARGSLGEQPRPHTLGPQTSTALRLFSEGVSDAASRGIPLEQVTSAAEASKALYKEVFRDELQEALYRLQGQAGHTPVLMRLMLPDPELQGIPWEALCRPGTSLGYLGTLPELFLARGVHSAHSWKPQQVSGAVRLLAISPSHEDAPHWLRSVLHPSIEAGEIEWLEPLTGRRANRSFILDRLRREPTPHILHFIGHGCLDAAGVPLLRMADNNGQESWLKVELLARELEGLFGRELRLVTLEACAGAAPGALASAAEQLARSGAHAVLAHLWTVRADVARRCSATFYRSLTRTEASAGNVARSLHDARRTLLAEFEESAEAFSPVLYLRGRDSLLFDLGGRGQLPSAPRSPVPTPPRESQARPRQVDLGILISLKEEFRIFQSLLPFEYRPERDELTGQYDYVFDLPGSRHRCVVTLIGELNPEPAALQTDRLIRKWNPPTVVMLGIAAGLHPEVRIGDVVVATQVDNYLASASAPSGAAGAFEFRLGGTVYQADHDLITRVRNFEFLAPGDYREWGRRCEDFLAKLMAEDARREILGKRLVRESPELLDGHLASGSVVAAAREFTQWLHQRDRNLKALDMESAGLVAAAFKRVEPKRTLVIRGIAGGGAMDTSTLDALEGGVLRRYAMHNATQLLWILLKAGVLPGAER